MIYSGKDIAYTVTSSRNKTLLSFPGEGSIQDIVRFGFSYVETEDNFVAYVLAHPKRMKDVLCCFSESELNPSGEVLGHLWTAELIATKRLKENLLVFANPDLSVILFLEIPDPNKKWREECQPTIISA